MKNIKTRVYVFIKKTHKTTNTFLGDMHDKIHKMHKKQNI